MGNEDKKILLKAQALEELFDDYILKDNRWQLELTLISLFLNDYKLVDEVNFKSEYFKDDMFRKIFEFIKLETHEGIKLFDPVKYQKFYDCSIFDIDYIARIYQSNVFFISNSESCKSYASEILKWYKREQTQELNFNLNHKNISAVEYYNEMKLLSELSIENEVNSITNDDIFEALTLNDKGLLISDYKTLSDILKLSETDTVTVAGRSGFGKSAFLLNVYKCLSQDVSNAYKCQYYNLEVDHKKMIQRLVAITSNHNIKDFVNQNGKDKVIDRDIALAQSRITSNDSFIKSGSITLEELKATVLSNLDDLRHNVVFIDHVGLMSTTEKEYNKSEYIRLTYIMIELRKLCLDNNILMFIVSQFDRASVKSKEISMHSLKGSGEIENSSTHVLLLKESTVEYSNDSSLYEEVAIDIGKNRNGIVRELDNYTFFKEKQKFVEVQRRRI